MSEIARVCLVLAVALGAGACGSGDERPQGGTGARTTAAAPDSIAGLSAGAEQFSVLQAQASLPVGKSRFAFGFVSPQLKARTGGSPQVWAAPDESSPALGPFAARWLTWSPPKGDPLGAPPGAGFYTADLDLPRPGNWMLLVRDQEGGKRVAGVAAMAVEEKPAAALGSKALSEPTPVATTPEEAAKIDTRNPPSPMHYISLDQALGNGRPTVVAFASPLLCRSRICGPVIDEVLDVYEKVGRERANFIHVEVFPERDPNKPAPQLARWGFKSEPWVLVIDRDGVIRGRFEGPVVSPEIQAALQPLLAPA